jgi:hypothetical protein
LKIIVGGVISLQPFSAGNAWDRLHYVLGLRKLGHEVLFLEEIGPDWCVDGTGRKVRLEESVNRRIFKDLMRRFQIDDSACQICDGDVAGMSRQSLVRWTKEAELLINISGHVQADEVLSNVERRVYLDQDPVFTQLWKAEYGKDLDFGRHEVFLTVGLNIGTPHSQIPDGSVPWQHTLPPVFMDRWPQRADSGGSRFSTIASWAGYSDLSYRGEWYQSKYVEFVRFAALPRRVSQDFELALKDYRERDEGIQLLKENGWILTSAQDIADLDRYQKFVYSSRAEIGIAKNAYVRGHSGWFSDRSGQYLASGRPVLLESTGIERHLPAGDGVLTFSTMEEAVAGVEEINARYEHHCGAAREFAVEFLDSTKVLARILELCGGRLEKTLCPQ